MQQFIAYYRVSTVRQGRSGLGLEAQQETVRRHLQGVSPLASYCEVESGRRADRPELRKALDHCRRANAVLVISKIDRLSRSARFLHEILDSDVEVRFCDMPQVAGPQGKFLLASMANVAELEAGMISQRTKDALAACKARGKRLGARPGASPLSAYLRKHGNAAGVQGCQRAADKRAEPWREIFQGMVADGLSLNAMAKALSAKGERTPRGGTWTPTACSRMLGRLDLAAA